MEIPVNGRQRKVLVRPERNGYVGSWGLTPLEDQHLGGLIMWIPAGLVYIIAGLALFAGWLREAELRAARRDRANPSGVAL